MSAATAEAGVLTKHTLPELAYGYDALEPFLDKETMELHHSKHHQGYVNGVNGAEAALAKAREAGDYGLIQHWSRQLAFHYGGHYLHSMFWATMAPNGNGGGGEPTGALADKINEDFGDFGAFQAQFSAASATVEGSGWGLLHYRPSDDRLVICQAENQHKVAQWGATPILGIDVWEHAYYLKYQNRRPEYIKAWWNVINWSAVAERFASAKG